jgi:hypothetical protein
MKFVVCRASDDSWRAAAPVSADLEPIVVKHPYSVPPFPKNKHEGEQITVYGRDFGSLEDLAAYVDEHMKDDQTGDRAAILSLDEYETPDGTRLPQLKLYDYYVE